LLKKWAMDIDIQLYIAYMYSKYAMLLHLSDLSSEPLHAQISRQIRAKILVGDLPEETALPSIRKMAREQKVSVTTVQRAYEDLDKEGLINSKRGKGFFVAGLSNKEKSSMALDRLKDKLGPVITDAIEAGLDERQVAEVVQDFFNGKVRK